MDLYDSLEILEDYLLPLLILIGAALLVWINYLIAREFYRVAKEKGYHAKKYFWLPFWLGMIGYFLVAALPDHADKTPALPEDLPKL